MYTEQTIPLVAFNLTFQRNQIERAAQTHIREEKHRRSSLFGVWTWREKQEEILDWATEALRDFSAVNFNLTMNKPQNCDQTQAPRGFILIFPRMKIRSMWNLTASKPQSY